MQYFGLFPTSLAFLHNCLLPWEKGIWTNLLPSDNKKLSLENKGKDKFYEKKENLQYSEWHMGVTSLNHVLNIIQRWQRSLCAQLQTGILSLAIKVGIPCVWGRIQFCVSLLHVRWPEENIQSESWFLLPLFIENAWRLSFTASFTMGHFCYVNL